MYIDTHCHMSRNDYSDIPFLIEKIKEAGIDKIIVNGCSLESCKEVIELTKKYDIVYGALGFHPTELEGFKDSDFDWLEEHINDDKIVALGEIGLDYYYDNTDKEKQNYAFKRQLEIAKKHNKPIIVHSRDAIADVYKYLKEYRLRGVLHCFGSSVEMAREFIKLGYFIGVGGVVTFKNAKNIVNVIKDIDLEYILLETDSPYLTPEPYRGKQNDSSYIPLIASKIASVKGVLIEDVERVTSDNAKGLFDF